MNKYIQLSVNIWHRKGGLVGFATRFVVIGLLLMIILSLTNDCTFTIKNEMAVWSKQC